MKTKRKGNTKADVWGSKVFGQTIVNLIPFTLMEEPFTINNLVEIKKRLKHYRQKTSDVAKRTAAAENLRDLLAEGIVQEASYGTFVIGMENKRKPIPKKYELKYQYLITLLLPNARIGVSGLKRYEWDKFYPFCEKLFEAYLKRIVELKEQVEAISLEQIQANFKKYLEANQFEISKQLETAKEIELKNAFEKLIQSLYDTAWHQTLKEKKEKIAKILFKSSEYI